MGVLLALIISLSNYLNLRSLKNSIAESESSESDKVQPKKHEDIELGDVMTKLQRHSNKLWFSARAGNWQLAKFYIHELEETFEILSEGEIVDEGVDISMLTKSMGIGPLNQVEKAIDGQDSTAFLSSFENLTRNCNSCHQSSNHPFVVIKTPTIPVLFSDSPMTASTD